MKKLFLLTNRVKSISLLILGIFILFYPAKTQTQSSSHFFAQNNYDPKTNYPPTFLTPQQNVNQMWETIQSAVVSQAGPFVQAKPVGLNLDQVRNGSATDPVVPPTPAPWVNGNAGASNAHYAEGWSIPYRLVIDNLVGTGLRSVDIEWDTRQSNSSAIDFITNYDLLDYLPGSHVNSFGHPQELINPLPSDLIGYSFGTSVDIVAPNFGTAPAAVTTYYNALMAYTNPAGQPANKFTIINGNITSMSYISQGNVAAAAASTSLRIFFTNTASTVIISWGGHIAKGPGVWGDGNSAAAVSGSPYHTRILAWDPDGDISNGQTSIGNQDRSLSADAVLDPPQCTLSGPTSMECNSTSTFFSGVSASDLTSGTTFQWSVINSGTCNASISDGSHADYATVSSGSGCGCSFTVRFKLLKNNTELSHCDGNVSVTDTHPPVFTSCPSGSDLGCNPTSTPAAGSPTATDNCTASNSITINSSLASEVGTGCSRSRTRTYTATDACGNTATCSQVFTYTVDVTGPVFTSCPSGSNLGCNPTSIPAAGTPTASDNCTASGSINITNNLGSEVGTGCSRSRTRTYTATDACGNTSTCQQVFTYTVDVTPPVFTSCPAGSDLGCNPTSIPEAGTATASDNCGGSPTIGSVLGDEVVGAGCSRSRTRTYTATDGCGNTATCQQVFTYTTDVTPPTFTSCPAGSDLGCNPADIPAAGTATASDNCGGSPSIGSSLGSAVNTGGCNWSRTRTYTATDGCGNTATCQQVFTYVVDQTPPVFTNCLADVVVECDASVAASDLGTATASDACGTPTVTSSDEPNTVGCVTVITRTWKATDACGNTATCVQHITKRDRTGPVIDCEAGTATDNCSPTSDITIYLKDGIWTAIDGSGNITTATQNCSSQGGGLRIQNTITTDNAEAQTTVKAYPNPFNDRVKFVITSPQAGYGTLDIMNMLGQKIKTVYAGQIPAGTQSFEMSLPNSRFTTLVYILRMNGKQVTGKLIQAGY